MTAAQLEALENILAGIDLGYGWVAEDMMQVYCADDSITPWKEVEEYLDEHFTSYRIAGEKVWSIDGSSAEKIEADYRREFLD